MLLNAQEEVMFAQFVAEQSLEDFQAEQFKRYLSLIRSWNEYMNITTIVDVDEILNYHFQDSLVIRTMLDFNTFTGFADIGTGGGFPGIPLKICYPNHFVVLLEVNQKKIKFLEAVIKELALTNIVVEPLDWRTFLRKTTYPLDVMFSRAALHTDELIRMFRPKCFYRNARLMYWASRHWLPGQQEKLFIEKEVPYNVGQKQRKLVFFINKQMQ